MVDKYSEFDDSKISKKYGVLIGHIGERGRVLSGFIVRCGRGRGKQMPAVWEEETTGQVKKIRGFCFQSMTSTLLCP